MGHGAAAAGLERQSGLGAVERLDLVDPLRGSTLVDGHDNGVRGRVHVEADDVLDLGGECWVVGPLVGGDENPRLDGAHAESRL